jgi:cysteine desulfuration protein SufE
MSSEQTSSGNRVLDRQAKLKAEFSRIPSWEDRYKRLIEYGKKLAAMPEELHEEKLKIRGCQSQVWLHASLTPLKLIHFQADSDALIVKGLVALLLEVYSDASADEILGSPTEFLKDLGFEGHLSPSRANGLYAMLKQILYYAQAFKILGA